MRRRSSADNPSIGRSQSNLALVVKDLGQLEEARDLLRKAHGVYLSRFGRAKDIGEARLSLDLS
jgi:hypothetical protein